MSKFLKEVSELGAKRLVIDSFSAMAQAFKDPHEVRVFLHTILGKICRIQECTTIVVIENPYECNNMVLGIEGFVADGIIILKRSFLERRLLRELEFFKMRGTPIQGTNLIFTLKGGFKAFTPFKFKLINNPQRFQPQPDTACFYSTGSPSLDEMLGGGYLRGSSVLIEIDKQVSRLQYQLIVSPTISNFIAQGKGVIIIPSGGVDCNLIRKKSEEDGLKVDEINSLMRICIRDHPGIKPEPNVLTFKGENVLEDYKRYMEIKQELMERTGQPLLSIIGDRPAYRYLWR